MTNKILDGAVDLEIDGSILKLEFDWNSIALLEQEAGVNICTPEGNKMLAEAFGSAGVSPFKVRLLFWAGLQANYPGMTLNEAGKLIRMDRLQAIIEAIAKAIRKAFPAPDIDEQEKAPASDPPKATL